jgi:hypothetical protein
MSDLAPVEGVFSGVLLSLALISDVLTLIAWSPARDERWI